MKVFFSLVTAVLLIFDSSCFADRYLYPVKNADQEELFLQGASILVSKKTDSVLMYQTTEMVHGNKACFSIGIGNGQSTPLNVRFDDLVVTDQDGNRLRIVPKQELIGKKRGQARRKRFLNCLVTGFQAMGADQAGRVDYQSSTNGMFNYNGHSYGSSGWSNSSGAIYGTTSTSGVLYSGAARQQYLRQVDMDAARRMHCIENDLTHNEGSLNECYFDSNTIFPGSPRLSNIQIEIPKHLRNTIEYIVFHLKTGGETHQFYFHCGTCKGR